MRRSSLIFLLSLLIISAGFGQDSTTVLSLNDFIQLVSRNHPVAKQADLINQRARAQLLLARGAFDPSINSEYDRKSFDGKNYYSWFTNELKIPAWFGIEVKTGYDRHYGLFLDDERKIPANGQSYLGISVPLLQNMITDKKRTALRQAKIFVESGEAERLMMLNDLLLDAVSSYAEWSNAYYQSRLLRDALTVAISRFNFVKQTALLGDRPAIDTTEALTQVFTRRAQLLEQALELQNSTVALSYFLWNEDSPVFPDSSLRPEPMSRSMADSLAESLDWSLLTESSGSSIPVIRFYNLKIKSLEAEKRLKIELLKPSLNASYSVLGGGGNVYADPQAAMFRQNYKFGLGFSMPLSFTSARAEFKLVNLKLADARFSLQAKQADINVKLNSSKNELFNLLEQIRNTEALLQGYERLLEGEETRFRNGESSMFLVNARENKVYDTRLKLNELMMKIRKSRAKFDWAAGALSQ
jgi:outer membrane protein TolC